MNATAPMRVCFLLRDLDNGGVERVVVSVAGRLAQLGWDVEILLFERKGDLLPHVPDGVRLSSLERPASFRGNPLAAWQVLTALKAHLAGTRPDVLVSAKEQCNLVAMLARGAKDNPDVRVVLTRHVPLRARGATGASSFVTRSLYRLLHRRAEALVGVSDGVAADLRHLVPARARGKVHRIYNPVVDESFFDRAAGEPEDWPREASEVFVGVGRHTEEKGFDLLLRAFAGVAGAGRRLVLVGDGPERQSLEALARELGIRDRVVFAGARANALPYIRRADCLVLPSRYEGFGLVIVEALALGTRVIAADCPVGPRELLAGGDRGRLVPAGDVGALAAAMGDWRTIPLPSASDAFLKPFTRAAAGDAYAALLLEVAGRAGEARA